VYVGTNIDLYEKTSCVESYQHGDERYSVLGPTRLVHDRHIEVSSSATPDLCWSARSINMAFGIDNINIDAIFEIVVL
jgi:hypothetical protein